MGFTAESSVVALDWDLRPFSSAHGTVKEPTQAQLDAYVKGMSTIFSDLGVDLPATASEAQIEEAVDKAFSEKLAGKSMMDGRDEVDRLQAMVRERRIKTTVSVCGGKPTVKQVTDLPPRVREAFLGWVAGWAADPTSAQIATTGSPVHSNNGG